MHRPIPGYRVNIQLENTQLEPFHSAMQELENTQLEPLSSHNTKPLMKGVGNAGIQLDCERKRSFYEICLAMAMSFGVAVTLFYRMFRPPTSLLSVSFFPIVHSKKTSSELTLR